MMRMEKKRVELAKRIERYVRDAFPDRGSQYKRILGLELNKIKQQEKVQIPFILRYYNRKGRGSLRSTRLLDLGCGTGGATVAWAMRGAKCTGIDMLEEDLEIAKLRAASERVNAEFIMNKSLILPFRDGSFDIVICDQVLEHTPGLGTTVSEIRRVMKKGGIAYIDIPNRLFPFENHYRLLFAHWFPSKMHRALVRLAGRKYFDYPVFFLSYRKIKKEMLKQRFEIIAGSRDYIATLDSSSLKNRIANLLVKLHVPAHIFSPTNQFIVRKR